MKVLVIDSKLDLDCWGARDILSKLERIEGLEIHVRRAPQMDLPKDLSSFDRIILSGSREAAESREEWITPLEELTRRALDRGTPMLGVCFGHQIMARALGGQVRRMQTPEVGWTQIELLSKVSLVDGLPSHFFSYNSHYDIVSKAPPGSQVFARSSMCQIQGFRIHGKPLYGIQFHPETGLEGANQTYRELKAKGDHAHFQHWSKPPYVPKIGIKIFENFVLNGEG